MSDDTIDTPETDLLDASMGQLKARLMTSEDNFGPIWIAWHYLQLFSLWGLRLPNTEDHLKISLNVKDPSNYSSFYPYMLEGFQKFDAAGRDFTASIFPQMVEMGNRLSAFARDAGAEGTGVLSAVLDMLREKDTDQDVIDLIQDLQRTADTNAEQAKKVKQSLEGYVEALKAAQESTDKARKGIEANKETNQEAIEKFRGEADREGSIKYIEKAMQSDLESYEYNKRVTQLAPTYSWIPFAGIIVFGIYLSRTMENLKSYDINKAEKEKAENLLSTAYTTQTVQNTAEKGLGKAVEYSARALNEVAVVQESWKDVSKSLADTVQRLDKSFRTVDDEARLKARSRVRGFTRKCIKAWTELWPAIELLTKNPYVTLKKDDVSVTEAVGMINQAVDNKATQE